VLAAVALARCVGGDDSTNKDAAPDSTTPDGSVDTGIDVNKTDASDAEAGNPCLTSDAGGTLDQSFNTGVKNLGNFAPNAAAVDSAGLIYVGGIQGSGCAQANSGAVYRFTETGSLDTTYNANGTAGHVCIHYDVVDAVYALAIDRTGRLVVGGLSYDGASFEHATMTRLKADGTLDTSFNTTGKLDLDPKANSTHIGIGAVQGLGFLPQSFNDKIVVTGSPEATQVGVGKTNTGFVMRLGDDGAIDSAFATSGVFKDTTVDGFYRVYVDGSGIITTVGSSLVVPKAIVVRQLDLTGKPVASFGDAGVFTTPLGGNFGDDGREIVVTGSRILAGASVDFINNGGLGRVGVVALTSAGVLDTTWGGNDAGVPPGIAISNPDLGWHEYYQITALAAECDGKLLTGATHLDVDAAQDLEVRRLTANGALDPTFGNNGHAIFPLAGNEIAVAVAQDPTTSRIVIVGRDGGGNTVLARFMP
jgi:uncharacterized delta-60 repeat protein